MSPLFRSFWMGGFECSTHINRHGRLDMTAGVQHDVQAESDYALLRTQGMQTARDGLRWHLINRGNSTYDFSSFTPMLRAALKQGVQVIWDLCHYGWPDDVDLLQPAFVDRFGKFCTAAARHIREHTDEVPFYAPVNEISFFAWAASRNLMYPFAEGRDTEIKRQLVRAVAAAIEAIRAVDSRARFVFPEPAIHVVAALGHPEQQRRADEYSNSQFEAWDMIADCQADYLDILGCNFYSSNQWEVMNGVRLAWDAVPRDKRWRPLNFLLKDVWDRYHKPMFIAETSHIGIGRGQWILEIANEARLAMESGVPLEGICLYPILDRYDWDNFHHWHNSGLWNLPRNEQGVYVRTIEEPYARDLRKARDLLRPLTLGG